MSWKITNKLDENNNWILTISIYKYGYGSNVKTLTIPLSDLKENTEKAIRTIKQIENYFPSKSLISSLDLYRSEE